MKMFDQMLNYFPNEMKKSFSDDLDIFKFHLEYCEEYPYEKAHLIKLEEHYYNAKKYSMAESMIDYYSLDQPHILLQRFHTNDPSILNSLKGNQLVGTIIELMNVSYKFGQLEDDSTTYQTIQNHPSNFNQFELGQTYVGIGCVDLTQLLFGMFNKKEKNSLKFIGIDMNIVPIARCHVLYKMLQMNCRTESILQVWYSSGWTNKTFQDFQLCCLEIFKDNEITNEDVKDLIKLWSKEKIINKKWLELWKTDSNSFDPLENLLSKRDRIDYSRYVLTGELFEKNNEYGNITMFCTLDNNKYQRVIENIFQTYSLKSFYYENSLLQTLENTLLENLNKLKKKIIKKYVICKFLVKEINPEKKEIIDFIKNLNCTGIFWSNIPDYYNNKEFLEMAKNCSGVKTIHICHFMNWIMKVLGASIVDYNNKSKKFREIMELKNFLIKSNQISLMFLIFKFKFNFKNGCCSRKYIEIFMMF